MRANIRKLPKMEECALCTNGASMTIAAELLFTSFPDPIRFHSLKLLQLVSESLHSFLIKTKKIIFLNLKQFDCNENAITRGIGSFRFCTF